MALSAATINSPFNNFIKRVLTIAHFDRLGVPRFS